MALAWAMGMAYQYSNGKKVIAKVYYVRRLPIASTKTQAVARPTPWQRRNFNHVTRSEPNAFAQLQRLVGVSFFGRSGPYAREASESLIQVETTLKLSGSVTVN